MVIIFRNENSSQETRRKNSGSYVQEKHDDNDNDGRPATASALGVVVGSEEGILALAPPLSRVSLSMAKER